MPRVLVHKLTVPQRVIKVLHRRHSEWVRELERWESASVENRVIGLEILTLDLAQAFFPKDPIQRQAFVKAATTFKVVLAEIAQVRNG